MMRMPTVNVNAPKIKKVLVCLEQRTEQNEPKHVMWCSNKSWQHIDRTTRNRSTELATEAHNEHNDKQQEPRQLEQQ